MELDEVISIWNEVNNPNCFSLSKMSRLCVCVCVCVCVCEAKTNQVINEKQYRLGQLVAMDL